MARKMSQMFGNLVGVQQPEANAEYVQRTHHFYDVLEDSLRNALTPCDHPFVGLFKLPIKRSTLLRFQPMPQAQIYSALADPHMFTGDPRQEDPLRRLHEMPDVSILWKGYCESGKLINVADWYTFFESIVEDHVHIGNSSKSQALKDDPFQSGPSTGQAATHSATKQEIIRARFIHAVHQLDYLGLLKHQNRRREHVAKAAFVQYPFED